MRVLMMTTAIATLAGAASPVLAQAVPAPPPETQASAVEDVVVTARRREESLQDVPIAVSALSGEQLSQQGLSNVTDLQYKVPSLTVTTSGASRSAIAFAIRGQRTNETQLLTDPPVATYFAEVVQPRAQGFGSTLFDLANVQVLKGVQGTLFGRNVTGGAVLVEPNAPKPDFEAEVTVRAGNYDLRGVYGMVNLPLVQDVLSLRLAGEVRRRDGYTIDLSNGMDFDDVSYESFRASLKFAPNEKVSSTLIFDTTNSDVNGPGTITTAMNPSAAVLRVYQPPVTNLLGTPNILQAFAAQQALRRPERQILGNALGLSTAENPFPGEKPFDQVENQGLTNRTTIQLGTMTLKNVIGYRTLKTDSLGDYFNLPISLISAKIYRDIEQFSEEIQLQGDNFSDRLSWTLGAYYFKEEGIEGSISGQFGAAAKAATLLDANPANNIPMSTSNALFRTQTHGNGVATTYSIYGAATYDFNDQWSLSAGLRHTTDEREAKVVPTVLASGACRITPSPVDGCALRNSAKWDALTYDVTLQFEPTSDLTFYGSMRHGFRAGGFSLRATSMAALAPFNPEEVDEIELGAKGRWVFANGASLKSSAAVFIQDYTNIQKQSPVFINGTVVTLITNTAAQKNSGAEFEGTLSLPNGFDLSGHYAHISASDISGSNGSFDLVGVPEHDVSISASKTHDLGGVGSLFGTISYTYRSRMHLDDFDTVGDQEGYGLLNARVSWENINGSPASLSVFGSNLTGEVYRAGVVSLQPEIGLTGSIFGDPRMFGVELNYKF